MSLDSIHKKESPSPPNNQLKNPKSFIIPVITIVIVIASVWIIVLKRNFSNINRRSQTKTDTATEEVSQALEDLTQKLDNLKEQKIFLQSTSSPDDSSSRETNIAPDFQSQENESTTNGHSYPSEEVPMPAQQY